MKLILGKLCTRWLGPFVVINLFYHGAVEVQSPNSGKKFKVNGYRLKHFYEGFQVHDITNWTWNIHFMRTK